MYLQPIDLYFMELLKIACSDIFCSPVVNSSGHMLSLILKHCLVYGTQTSGTVMLINFLSP